MSFNTEDELFDAYQSSMCSVIPYTDYSGAFPATVAMATNTPIIASDAMGIPEYVNGNGIVVKARSANVLADALRKMFTDETLRSDMGKNGRKLGEEKYNWDTIAKKTVDIYQYLLHK